ncbi:trypsin-like cysteine/serine peptidase domain-containing protein [Entophlyctis helioformis]|nr:trypsin-like cysteine/serine peptidase domain-containing protein [Entophlyctis helioformis]
MARQTRSSAKRRRTSASDDVEVATASSASPNAGAAAGAANGTSDMDVEVHSSLDHQQPQQWQKTIAASLPAIVSIRFSQVAAFDTEGPDTSEASGFVVDAVKGIILTNRHVVSAGPFVGEAIWHDHEEVDVSPIYRDPVHDFGFLRFDPSKIRFLTVTQIELAPALAQVGLDIRVVGNDAGEKLSILAGSISRLDRNAPVYGDMTYNDFNTFYLQAASSTSGGSSGSPVLNIEGKAVGLQAGGHTKAATDFFFPLDRVKRALELLRKDQPVSRGTIQVQFMHRPFDEVRRLGLREETEAYIRKTNSKDIGMLVAEVVVPEGPAYGLIEEGDVLVSVNGNPITKFVPLEDTLDNSVGKTICLKVERGGNELEFEIQVQDLHSITPDRFVEIGGAKVNNLSYQLARQFCVPVQGVYLTEAGGMLRLGGSTDSGWIISSVNTVPTPNLDAFIEVFKTIPDRSRVPITFYSIADVHTKSVEVVNVERHWSSFRLAVRNDKTGLWDYQDLGEALPPTPIEPMNASFALLDEGLGPAQHLLQSMVKVSMYMPCRIEGFPKSRRQGAGLILDAEKGLVVVSRNVVPMGLGDVTLTFADSIIIPGKVEFLHPTQNISIVSFDPKLVGTTPIRSAPISPIKLAQGHRVSLVALNHNLRPIFVETTVTDIGPVTIPYNATPRFRAINIESINLDTPLGHQCSSGVLADSQGRVQALWLSFLGERSQSGHDNEYHMGMDIRFVIQNVLPSLVQGIRPRLVGLAAEFSPIQISQSRNMGLTDAWVARIEASNPNKRQLFLVRKAETGSKTAEVLRDLDLVLSIDGKIVTDVSELDMQAGWGESVQMVVLRDNVEMTLEVPTVVMDGDETQRIVLWGGAVLHAPHKAVRQQSKTIPSGIYVSGRAKGSPALTYGIASTQWITHVNNVPTTNLDEFVNAVKDLPDNSYVRLKTMSFDLVPWVLSVKTVKHYWPTGELVRDSTTETGWRKVLHE